MAMPPYDRLRDRLRGIVKAACDGETLLPSPGEGKWDVEATQWGESNRSVVHQMIRDGLNYALEFELQSLGGIKGRWRITWIKCSTCEFGYEFTAGPGEFRAGSMLRIGNRAFDLNRSRSALRSEEGDWNAQFPNSPEADNPFGSVNEPFNTVKVWWSWTEKLKFTP